MPYVYNTPEDQAAMLAAIGADSVEALFSPIPESLRLGRPLDIPPAMGELELEQHLRSLADKNLHASRAVCFLGGGSYDHFVPAAVDTIGSRSEFYTSYTPYQAEVAQGNLQAIFEYQSMITRLTGLDVSNSSLYDGGSATAEAVLMAIDTSGRRGNVVLAGSLHPEYRQTVATYLECIGVPVAIAGTPGGILTPDDLERAITDETSCVVLQQPNFFGAIEDARQLTEVAHARGALMIAVFDPISLGLLERPGDWGADIAVAEGQSLGTAMSYGGPVLGILACRDALVRRIPGRIVGQTTDRRGATCYTLTMQTREQHIRRDKASSNVCTNQALFALRATVYLSLMGPQGLRDVARLCLQKSHYARQAFAATERFELAFDRPTFKEFVVRDKENNVQQLISDAAAAGVLAGVPLAPWYPELSDCFLVCVTEKRTRQEIDRLVELLEPGGSKAVADQLIQAGI
jgi:glycine dehydrogenase subunit 1